jgi:hypothetical protein
MNGSGKGGNNRGGGRPFRRREHEYDRDKSYQEGMSRSGRRNGDNLRYDKNKGLIFERPKWTAPKLSLDPLPTPECPYCGKIIKDISSAIADKESGLPVHFDCIIARLTEGEILEKGDVLSYIGGGRFGVVHFNSRHEVQPFRIKKIFEWENNENRAEWRKNISDHFSIT